MRKIARSTSEERRELFSETANAKGITAAAAEKDFWICWILMQIFQHPSLSKTLRFKGGTTLSKCFGIIERFSEDIDLILDWRVVNGEDPTATRSKSKQAKLNKEINLGAQVYIRDTILPELEQSAAGICKLAIDEHDAHTINVRYPSVFSKSRYLRDEIRLEIGPLANMLPFEKYLVTPYAAEIFPDVFAIADVLVDAIVPQRTFWEKITILHAEAHRPGNKQQPKRYSRHYYDVYQMLKSEARVVALNDLNMLAEVVAFKKKFYPSGWAQYDLATCATMRLIPGTEVIANLKADYEDMREMIFGDYPTFDTILAEITQFQAELNKSG